MQAPSAELVGIDDDPPSALSLMPGDVVNLQLMSGSESTVSGLTVDERGVLHVPLAGDVDLSGVSLTEGESRIERALRPFDQTVRVTIILAQPNGQRATVLGSVASPGRYTVVPGMRLSDLLALAGDGDASTEGGIVVPLWDLRGARLVREGAIVPVSLERAVTGDPRHNVRIRPGDHLYVPPSTDSMISVLGEVNSARVLPYQEGLRLSRALAFAGGTTRDADLGDIVIVRGDHAAPRVYVAHLDELLEGEGVDPILAPGDTVFVSDSRFSRFRDVMAAISPLVSVAATTAVGAAVITTTAR